MKYFTKLSFATRNTMSRSITICLLFVFLFTGVSQAQMSSVTPAEYTDAMTNPLMGFRDNKAVVTKNYPYVTLIRQYIDYNVLDNNVNDGVQKIIDYTNNEFKDLELYNIKVIPRVILIWDDTQTLFPADIPYSLENWRAEQLKVRVEALVARLGQVWDNDPRIAFVETGLIGKWGEQESPVGADEPGVGNNNQTWAQILEPAFKNAFKNKKYMVRDMSMWTDEFKTGVYWDSYGAYKRMTNLNDDYQQILTYNRPPYERYKVAPMQGEVAYSQSYPGHMGNNEDQTVQNENYRQWFIDNIKSMHSVTCGLEFDHELAANDYGANLIQKAFGYRFLIKKFECNPRTEPGSTLNISAKILNDGSSPMYENWPLAVVLINETTKQIVHKSIILEADITKWFPGSNYDWKPADVPSFGTGTRVYLTPAVENTVNATIQIPSSLPVGEYLVGLSILDPTTHLPAVYFSVKNFFQTSKTQPLCRIGVGVNASSFTLNSSIFDAYNWKSGDTRSYAKTYMPVAVAGVTVSNSTLSFMEGSIAQLTASFIPTYATNKSISWSSNNPTVAAVSSNGLVSGSSVGSAVITATSADGGFTSTCTVTVTPYVPCDLPWSKSDFTLTSSSKYYTSGKIDISCDAPLTLSMDLSENTTLESADTIEVIYKVDTVEFVAARYINDFTTNSILKTGISGDSLEIIIRATIGETDETYSIKNLKVMGTVAKQDQTITFNTLANKTYGNADFSPGATSSSGLAIFYSSSNTAVATIVNGKIHIVGVGTTNITASQAGNTNFNAAESVVQPLIVIPSSFTPDNVAARSSVFIYPNPVSSILTIEFNNTENSNEIRIFNNVGQMVYSTITKNEIAEIDVQSLNLQGLIMIQIISGNNITNHKVLVE